MADEKKEPAWVTAMVDQRIALMKEHMGSDTMLVEALVVTPLTEPNPFAGKAGWERWERTCDRCGLYCPAPIDFYTGTVGRREFGTQLLITFGACTTCAKEA